MFSFFFTRYCDLIKDGLKKVLLFSKEVKMLELKKLWKLSIVGYTVLIVIDVSFLLSILCCRSVNFAINRLVDVLGQPYTRGGRVWSFDC